MVGTALALRSELYNPNEIFEFVKLADATNNVSHLFLPDIPGAQEALELCSSSLAVTRRIKIGSGVIRISEHDPRVLSRRIATIQWMSANRFVLGIGTGSPGRKPKETIEKMFLVLEETKKEFPSRFNNRPIKFPDVLVASLRSGIATRSVHRGEGLLLNFCSPEYAGRLLSQVGGGKDLKTFACYIKIFYSEKKSTAEKLLAEEFAKYDRLSQYHAMFERDKIATEITTLNNDVSLGRSIAIPEPLRKISLANPSPGDLRELVEKFRNSGINLPCIYPYFSPEERTEFKEHIMKEITSSF